MREFTEINDETTLKCLEQLADSKTSVVDYRAAMELLGASLAKSVLKKAGNIKNKTVCVACTVEDVDFLGKGIIEGLQRCGISSSQIRLACFWNERVNPFDLDDYSLAIAPIIKQYQEPVDFNNSVLIIAKSIISGACVVKTNLSTLIENSNPDQIFVVAPVVYKGAEERLNLEFNENVSKNFNYVTLAIDDQKTDDGKEVVPGVGGSVYSRLGFGTQDEKNTYVPDIVKRRRKIYFHSNSALSANDGAYSISAY